MDRDAVAIALKNERAEREWSLGHIAEELARRVEGPVPRNPTIAAYTSGPAKFPQSPDPRILVPIARLLGVDLDALGITEWVERESDLLVRLLRCRDALAGQTVAA